MPEAWADEWWSHRLTPAGVVRRALSFLLDLAIAAAGTFAFFWFFRGLAPLVKQSRLSIWENPDFWVAVRDAKFDMIGLTGLIYMLMNLAGDASPMGGSPGKRLCGIRVTDEFGERLSITAAIVRNLVKIVSLGAAGLGCIIIFWTRGHRALHDWAARSFVARG